MTTIEQQEAGLRRALEITKQMIEACEKIPPCWSFREGWKLGMEEVAYQLNSELHWITIQKQVKADEEMRHVSKN
jgi:hypothetical protein